MENKIMRKPLFNPEGDTSVANRRLINFNTTNINDFNNMKYEWVSDWYRQAMNNFWIPEEINLNRINPTTHTYHMLNVLHMTRFFHFLSISIHFSQLTYQISVSM